MEDKCPFCGAKEITPFMDKYKTWACQTSVGLNKNLNRHKFCYENQLATLQTRLVEAIELFKRWLRNEGNHVFQNSYLQERTQAFLANSTSSEMCIRCGKNEATRATPEGICEKCWEDEFGNNTSTPEMLVVRRDILELAQRALDCLCGCKCTCEDFNNKCPICQEPLVKFADQDCCNVCYAQRAYSYLKAALEGGK